MKPLRPAVCDFLRIPLGALGDVTPELLGALPDEFKFMEIKAEIDKHLAAADFAALMGEYDKSVQPATYELIKAATLIRRHVVNDRGVFQETLERMPVNAILKLVYGPDRRPDLYPEEKNE